MAQRSQSASASGCCRLIPYLLLLLGAVRCQNPDAANSANGDWQQKATIDCNGTSPCDSTDTSNLENSAPSGINDKTHKKDEDLSEDHPYGRNGPYWLVPPFLIGASTVIVIYIITHCLYLHCYATKKMKRLAERHYPPAIVISDDATSTGSYKTFTPIMRYNEQGELVEGGQSFLFYQPFDDDEWERQLSLRRQSSVRSSLRSSFRSSFRSLRRGSRNRQSTKSTSSVSSNHRKTSISLHLPKLFGGKRPSESSTVEQDTIEGATVNPNPNTNARRVCYVPVARSLSVPAATDALNAQGGGAGGGRAGGFIFSPVVLTRTQSCKSPSTKRPSVTITSNVTEPTIAPPVKPKINGSASDGDLVPPAAPNTPLTPYIIIGGTSKNMDGSQRDGSGTGRDNSTGNDFFSYPPSTSSIAGTTSNKDDKPKTIKPSQSAPNASASTAIEVHATSGNSTSGFRKPEMTSQKDKMETQVLFHLGDGGGEETEVHLCDIEEEHED